MCSVDFEDSLQAFQTQMMALYRDGLRHEKVGLDG